MKPDFIRRRGVAAAAAVALLAGCEPGAEGGYERIVHRQAPTAAGYAHPDPPEVTPGSSVGAPAARLVATSLPAGVTQEMVDEGQRLYGTVCAACHGMNGVGSPTGPPLNDGDWIHIAGDYPQIVSIIEAGVAAPRQFPGMMPPRGGGTFDEEQLRSIAAYVYALSHQEGA